MAEEQLGEGESAEGGVCAGDEASLEEGDRKRPPAEDVDSELTVVKAKLAADLSEDVELQNGKEGGDSRGTKDLAEDATHVQTPARVDDDGGRKARFIPRLNKNVDLAKGQRGFMVSCKYHREMSSMKEVFAVLQTAYLAIAPKQELEDDRHWIEPCMTGASGLLFYRLLDDTADPIVIVEEVYRRSSGMQWVQRIMPVEVTCQVGDAGVDLDCLRSLLQSRFEPPAVSCKVAVALNTRGVKSKERLSVIRQLMEVVNSGRNATETEVPEKRVHTVDLQTPEKVIMCEMLPIGVCLVSILNHKADNSLLEVVKAGIRLRSLAKSGGPNAGKEGD